MANIWLIPLLPALGAAINGLVGIRSFSRRTAGLLASTTMVGALALGEYLAGAATVLVAMPMKAATSLVV